ncbi:dimethylamine corrinoid protein 3 [archaeon]|nr:dimethylamine corrinoid protein 3 [archaeon]
MELGSTILTENALIERLKESIIAYDEEEARKVAEEIVAADIDPLRVIKEGISAGANVVSDKFESEEYYLPELMLAGEAMQAASDILMGGMSREKKEEMEVRTVGTAITATVFGDIHDIGKNILSMLLTVNGFKVIDLGRGIDSMEIVQRAREYKADIIALSALMTTTMPSQKEVIDILEAMEIRDEFIVMVGGGSTSLLWADEIGADGWAEIAPKAVELAKELIEKRRRG